MSEDQCPATTQTGFGVVRCQMPPGHPEHHTNQSYRWYGGYPESTTPPVPTCGALTWVSDEFGAVLCSRQQGHGGDHAESTTGRELRWPLADPIPGPEPVTNEPTRHYGSNDLAGVSRDDLIHNLFKRVEQLEQSSADGAATDEMFLTTNRTMDHLASGLGEIERRMTALERLVSGTDLNRQFERLNGAICTVNGEAQERHQEICAGLKFILDVLATMAPVIDSLKPAPLKVICGAEELHGMDHCPCKLDAGHDGHHYCGTVAWPNHQAPDMTGHPEECHGEVCVKPSPAQAERASGSPVQCPTQFREGQCLGWAGHHGECSAVKGSGNPQMEDPAEFTEQMGPGGGYPSDPVDPFQD
jgi:hypothetical protein